MRKRLLNIALVILLLLLASRPFEKKCDDVTVEISTMFEDGSIRVEFSNGEVASFCAAPHMGCN